MQGFSFPIQTHHHNNTNRLRSETEVLRLRRCTRTCAKRRGRIRASRVVEVEVEQSREHALPLLSSGLGWAQHRRALKEAEESESESEQ